MLWLWDSRKTDSLAVKLTKLTSLSVLNYIVIWNTDGSHHCQILYLSICLLAKIYLGPQSKNSSHLHDHSQTYQSVSQSVSSVTQSCLTLCDPMDRSTPGLPVHHQLPESMQTHVHRVGDAIQPSHLLLSPSPPAFNLSQHQGLFQSVSSSHQVAKVLEFQLQHQSFQWTLSADVL